MWVASFFKELFAFMSAPLLFIQTLHYLDHFGSIYFGKVWAFLARVVANAIGYAKHNSRSHDAVIRVYDDAGNVIETHCCFCAYGDER